MSLDSEETLAVRYRNSSPAEFVRSIAHVDPLEIAAFLYEFRQSFPAPDALLVRADFRPHLENILELAWTGDYEWTGEVSLRQLASEWIALRSRALPGKSVSYADSLALQKVGDSLPKGKTRADYYTRLIVTLREDNPPEEAEFIGLHSLLIAGARACFEAYDCVQSYRFAVDAWNLRKQISSSANSAHATAYAAISAATALGYLESAEFALNYQAALNMLAEAGDQIEKYEETSHSIVYLRIARAECQLWVLAARYAHVGGLSAAFERVTATARALEACTRLHIIPGFHDLEGEHAVLSPDLRPDFTGALAKVISFQASALAMLGETDQAKRSLKVLQVLPMSDVHRWDMRLDGALMLKNVDDVTTLLEDVIRSEATGAFSSFTPAQRARLYRRFSSLATEHSQALRKVDLPTSAAFWRQASLRWLSEAPASSTTSESKSLGQWNDEGFDVPEAAEESEYPSASIYLVDIALTESATDLDKLRENIRKENPLAVALSLWALVSKVPAQLPVGEHAEWQKLAEVADSWKPRHRKHRIKTRVQNLVEGADYKKFFLQVMDELAECYAPHLRPECLSRLCRLPNVSLVEKLELSREAARLALSLGRRGQAISATVEAAFAGLELLNEGIVREEIRKLVDVGQRALAYTAGAADLVETAKSVSTRLQDLAQALIDAEFYELAFFSLHVSYGWLATFFKEKSDLLEELQLVEQAALAEAGSTEALFSKMQNRILSDASMNRCEVNFKHFGSIEAPASGSAIIQIVPGKQTTRFAGTLCELEGAAVKFFGGRVEIGEGTIIELADVVWTELRPNRTAYPVPSLEQLSSDVVEPIIEALNKSLASASSLSGIDGIIFIPHGVTASLPLHAARGADGFLIERVNVGYRSAFDPQDKDSAKQGLSSLVGGWDPSIHADLEAKDIARLLRRNGYTVDRPLTIQEGGQKLLDPTNSVEILHLAGHGDFQPWPKSLTSSIQLSKTLSVSAAEWLHAGCRASFVFLNACNIGQADAADLNGFPLALRLRGATGVVAARAFIGPADARQFARDFYSSFSRSDSLTAFRAAAVTAIMDERHPMAWVPFIHDGAPFSGSKSLDGDFKTLPTEVHVTKGGQTVGGECTPYRGSRRRRDRNR